MKGTVGFGLPTIGIGLGAMVVDIPTAMLLIAAPTVVTNLWQIVVNGDPWAIGRRLWVFLLSSVSLIPVGIAVLIYVPDLPYEQLLGLVIVLYSVWTLVGKDLVLSAERSKSSDQFPTLVLCEYLGPPDNCCGVKYIFKFIT